MRLAKTCASWSRSPRDHRAVAGEVDLERHALLARRAARSAAALSAAIGSATIPRPGARARSARSGDSDIRSSTSRCIRAGLAAHDAEELLARLGVVAGVVLQRLDVADDRGERRAQLVAGVGDEVRAQLLGAAGLGAVLDLDDDLRLGAEGGRRAGSRPTRASKKRSRPWWVVNWKPPLGARRPASPPPPRRRPARGSGWRNARRAAAAAAPRARRDWRRSTRPLRAMIRSGDGSVSTSARAEAAVVRRAAPPRAASAERRRVRARRGSAAIEAAPPARRATNATSGDTRKRRRQRRRAGDAERQQPGCAISACRDPERRARAQRIPARRTDREERLSSLATSYICKIRGRGAGAAT